MLFQLADSVVSKGRECLERSIQYVHQNRARWGGTVVYGDTDSLFVHLPNKTKDEAFVIGQQIADEITLANPKPIKLKFEKVYLPCILQVNYPMTLIIFPEVILDVSKIF